MFEGEGSTAGERGEETEAAGKGGFEPVTSEETRALDAFARVVASAWSGSWALRLR